MIAKHDNADATKLSVEDSQAIADVVIRYATAIDRHDWSLLKSCFTDDFEGDYGDGKRWSSADQIVRYMIDVHRPFGLTLHRISNIVAQSAAHGATARSYVDALLMEKEPGGPTIQADGYYDDELVIDRGEWRIKKRSFSPVRVIVGGKAA